MVLNLGASLFRPWTRVGGLVLGNLCAVSKLCRSLCAPAWAASPQLLSALHAGGEKDVEKSGLLKALCVPGVPNSGSLQRILDAVQVSQPFVLRSRCLTYFQVGMLGHTLAFSAFVNTPPSWGRLLSCNRFSLMLWEWLAWRIFPRWHQQPVKYTGSFLQQGDPQVGQARVSVFGQGTKNTNMHPWGPRTGNERLHVSNQAFGPRGSVPFSALCEFNGREVTPPAQQTWYLLFP